VRLTESVDAGTPVIDADPGRMRGVLGNLVSNALAHAHAGGTIGVSAMADGGWVLLTVRDDGTGIPADLLPRVFRSVREGRIVHRLGTRPRHRPGCRGGTRRIRHCHELSG